MTKHTSAPWRVHNLYKTCVEANEDTLIAALETRGIISKPQSEYSIPSQTQQKANARLIAAAPELLEALKSAVWMLTRDYIDPQKREIIEKCESAIAKAEGKSCANSAE